MQGGKLARKPIGKGTEHARPGVSASGIRGFRGLVKKSEGKKVQKGARRLKNGKPITSRWASGLENGRRDVSTAERRS